MNIIPYTWRKAKHEIVDNYSTIETNADGLCWRESYLIDECFGDWIPKHACKDDWRKTIDKEYGIKSFCEHFGYNFIAIFTKNDGYNDHIKVLITKNIELINFIVELIEDLKYINDEGYYFYISNKNLNYNFGNKPLKEKSLNKEWFDDIREIY